MGQTILIVIMMLFFIREQTRLSKVSRWQFFILPLFSAYLFFNHLTTDIHLGAFLGIAVISLMIGFYQSRSLVVRIVNENRYFFVIDGRESPMYQKNIYSKSGRTYLIGWLLAFVFQIVIAIYFHGFNRSFFYELADVFSLTGTKAVWYAWEIYFVSSFSYLLFAISKSKRLKNALLKINQEVGE